MSSSVKSTDARGPAGRHDESGVTESMLAVPSEAHLPGTSYLTESDALLQAESGPSSAERGDGEAQALKPPRTVVYIIGNEFCERFAFYGMRAILGLFLAEKLGYSEDSATELVHLFIVLAYFFPLPGAFISDSFAGKYRVILYLSLAYCLGLWLVSLSASVAETSTSSATVWCALGLLLVTTGTGGIKPCVSSFGGDQIELTNPPGPARDRLLRWFFSYFYFSINVGSTFSMIAVPILRANVSYTVAFALPAALMMISLFIFWAGRHQYLHQPPAGNLLAQVLSIIWFALFPQSGSQAPGGEASSVTRSGSAPALPSVEEGQVTVAQAPLGSSGSTAAKGNEEPLQIKKLHKRGSKRAILPPGYVVPPHWLDPAKRRFGEQEVEDVKQLLRVLLLFLPAPMFWSLYDQQASRWTFQAEKMDGRLPFGLTLLPDQMQTLNAVGILVMIPLFDQCLYPLAERLGLSIRPIARMAGGIVLCGVSFFMAALLQVWIQNCPTAPQGGVAGGVLVGSLPLAHTSVLGGRELLPANSTISGLSTVAPLTAGPTGASAACVSLLWQGPQYLIITAAEIMFSITGLELAYSQAPSSMTSVVSAAWLVTDAVGNLFTVAVIGSISPFLTQIQEFILFGILCIISMFLLLLVGQGFTYVQSCDD